MGNMTEIDDFNSPSYRNMKVASVIWILLRNVQWPSHLQHSKKILTKRSLVTQKAMFLRRQDKKL